MKSIISWARKTTTLILCAVSSFSVLPASAEELSPSAFRTLGSYDVVIVGELHDNQAHHDNQAAIARQITPSALVFEMLTPDQAAGAAGVPRDDADALDAALGWSDTHWPDFAMYFPIFEAAPDAVIYGAALPRDEVRAAVKQGAAAVFDGDSALFGLDQTLNPEEQTARNALQSEAHCNALPEDILPGMVEAQRLRDASFARTTLRALEETGGPVLVITGNGHARNDWGMPRYLKRGQPGVKIASVGQILSRQGTPAFDYWIVTGDYTPLNGDPCAAFN